MRLRNGAIDTPLGSRGYLAATCTAGKYNNTQYLALDLRGKSLKYTTDMSGAGCGCNAALYLTSMHQNKHASDCGDFYCDANNVCGQSCAEIDIQEGNRFAWHSTLHGAQDHFGLGKGYGGGGDGWSGPRDWPGGDFGPKGKCIDTDLPFQVAVSFPLDEAGKLKSMDVYLTQDGHDCPLALNLAGYNEMAELDAALAAGMTPIMSYWSSDDMLWMDGKGDDEMGPCQKDFPDDCGESVRFYDFSVTPAFPPTTPWPTEQVSGPSQVDWASIGVFLAGAASMLALQVLCVLGVWTVKLRAQAAGPDASPKRGPPSTHGLLKEGAGAGAAQTPTRRRPTSSPDLSPV